MRKNGDIFVSSVHHKCSKEIKIIFIFELNNKAIDKMCLHKKTKIILTKFLKHEKVIIIL